MTDTPNNDNPGFVAQRPEHCDACYRLIQPGQIYYLAVGQAFSVKLVWGPQTPSA